MRARIIESAVCYGIFKEILMDETGFSMGTAPWTEEITQQFYNDQGVDEISATHNDIFKNFYNAKTISTALRFELCKQVLFDYNNIPTEIVPWTGDMLQRIEALTNILTIYDFQVLSKAISQSRSVTDKCVFDLVMHFGTSKSPKSTRSSTAYSFPGRPASVRSAIPSFHSMLATQHSHTGLVPRSSARFASPLALCTRRVSSLTSQQTGTSRLLFALYGGQQRSYIS